MALIVGNTIANNTGDVLNATSSTGDEVRGLTGNDTIFGGPGRDTLYGNEDSDVIFADSNTNTASGNDSLLGGQGNDTLIGSRFGFGGDSLNGNKGDDVVIASIFAGDRLFGGQDNDTLYGSNNGGSDDLIGNLGNDRIFGGIGDRLFGEAGDDALFGGSGAQTLTGGSGADDFIFQDIVTKAFTAIGIPTVTEGGYGGLDIISDFNSTGSGEGDVIDFRDLAFGASVVAESTSDVNTLGGVRLTVTGSNLDGSSAAQVVIVNDISLNQLLTTNSILVNGNVFNTTTSTLADGKFTFGTLANVGNTVLPGDNIANDIIGTINNDTLVGNGGDDTLSGMVGNDSLFGGSDNDRLIGGTGTDTLTGGTGYDTFVFNRFSEGVDTITDFNFTTGVNATVAAAFFPNPVGLPGGEVIEVGLAFGGVNLGRPVGSVYVADLAGNVSFAGPGTYSNGALIPNSGFGVSDYLASAGAPSAVFASGGAQGSSLGFSAYQQANSRGAFYFDQVGGGLFYDSDGPGTGAIFEKFAQLSPTGFGTAPLLQII